MEKIKASCILVLSLVFLAACTGNDKESAEKTLTEKKVTDSVTTAATIDALPQWKNFIQTLLPDFDAQNFTATYTSPLETFEPLPADSVRMILYKPYLAYNADSSQAIDVYSYNLLLRRRGQDVVAMNGEPDSQINLVDIKNKTTSRIFFAGPSTVFWDAQWKDSSLVLVTGTEEYKPAYWLIDLNKKEIVLNVYNDSTKQVLDRDEYLKQKMKGVVFR